MAGPRFRSILGAAPARIVEIAAACLLLSPGLAGAESPVTALKPRLADYVIPNYRFASGETLPELRLHYTTLGTIHRDAHGRADNAVLILHGTGGSGHSFLVDRFAGVLFGKGQPLDVNRFYIILPDAIGHGGSSKPSDGLHAKFPHYDYEDMVTAQYALLTQGLKIDRLRLVLGTSMGCMHSWMWAERYPDFVDAYMPLACLPVAIAGRNLVWRGLVMDAIRSDPQWLEGEYRTEPVNALRTVAGIVLITGSAPIQMQLALPTHESADEFREKYMEREMADLDANDALYQYDASRNFDPSDGLEKITSRVLWINSADDFINPPELGIAEREIRRVKNGRFVLLPASEKTHGHGTHTWAAAWEQYLRELLATTEHKPAG